MKNKLICFVLFLSFALMVVSCDNPVSSAPSSGSQPNGNPSPQQSYESIVAGVYSLGNISYNFNADKTGTKNSGARNIRAIADGAFTWKVNNKNGNTYTATITQNGSTDTAIFDTSGANYTVTIADVVYAKGSLSPTHTHTYSNLWSTSETHHWKTATCEHTSEIKDRSEHDFGVGNICSVCRYVKDAPPHEHNFSIEVAGGINPSCTQSGTKKLKCTGCDEVVDRHLDALGHTPSDNFVKTTGDEQNHHKYCSVCGEKVASEAHSFAGGKCSVCGYEKISPPNSGTPDSTPTQLDNGNWQLFAPGVTMANGWHDANKTGGDNDLCWAATSSNLVAWWQDLYVKNGGQLPSGVKTIDTKIFDDFKNNWGNTSGTYLNGVLWYFVDSSLARGGAYLISCVNPQDWNPLFAKAYKIVEDTSNTRRFTTIADFSGEVIAGLKKGAIGLKLTKSGQGGHAITLWGAEYNTSNQITAVYVTDSDDRSAELKRYELEQKTDSIMLKNYSVDGWQLDKIHGIMILYAP